jgi:hypothetical protein
VSQLVCAFKNPWPLQHTFPPRLLKCVTGAINWASQRSPGVNIYEPYLVWLGHWAHNS